MRNASSTKLHRLVDFVVMGLTFYASCVLLQVELKGSLFVSILAFSTILLACVRLSKRAVSNFFQSIGESTRQILGNAIGILVGACIMLLFGKLLSSHSDIRTVVFFSSVMAFFVLGTISPFTHRTSLGRLKSSVNVSVGS